MMLFAKKSCLLREEKQLLQRPVSAALEMDYVLYCKIEQGDRAAKQTQVIALVKLLSTDDTELLTLWLADKVIEILAEKKELAGKVLAMGKEKLYNM